MYLLDPPDPTVREPEVHVLTPAQALPRLMANRHMAQALDREGTRATSSDSRGSPRPFRSGERVRPLGLTTLEKTLATIETDARRSS